MDNSKRIIFFDEINSNNLELVGGKAMALSEMIKAGVNVPPGFSITTDTYRLGLTDEIVEEILKAFDKLQVDRVAVRSSAVAEDSKEASWAGQLETYLNVDKKGLIEAVKKCWSSVNSEHAKEYAKQHNIDHADNAVGVVVQQMVDSDISGVMFTANPVTNNRDEIIIESIYGLGELLVSGSVTPENFTINRNTKKVTSHNSNQQNKMLIYKDGENIELNIPDHKLKISTLKDKNLRDLIATAENIESNYGSPQDIEWAIENDKLYITQTRPITTLRTASDSVSLEQEFLNQNSNDKVMRFEGDFIPFQLMIEWWNYIGPDKEIHTISPVLFYFTPERTTAFISHNKYNGAAKDTFADLVNGRLSLQDFKDGYEKYATRLSQRYEDYFEKSIRPSMEKESFDLYKEAYDDFHGLIIWTLFYEQLDEATVSKVLANEDIDLKKMWDVVKLPVFPSFDSRKNEHILSALEGKVSSNYIRFAFTDYTFFASEEFVKKQLTKYDANELKSEIKKSKELTRKAKQQLEEYLNSADAFTKNIVEILGWVLFSRDERKDIINKAELLLFHISHQLFDFWNIDKKLVSYTGISDVLQGREYIKTIESDLPKRPDGFSVLYQTDGTSIFGYENLKEEITSLDDFILSQHKSKDGRTLQGEIGNIGKARGQVRIIRKNAEFDNFQEGEILVTGMTRPEFVPLMKKSAGIITDEGGITSHAAIVSRELNKPCIIGTRIATQILKDGDLVKLDANSGVVTIL
ncbi:MAG TPA: PEP/pyruvate-binding domain-containing protein [Patescibacteria group bacterium]|nr:PEP/pyruvate-binding domain-containing protein [Patescibacteria group bacterium]